MTHKFALSRSLCLGWNTISSIVLTTASLYHLLAASSRQFDGHETTPASTRAEGVAAGRDASSYFWIKKREISTFFLFVDAKGSTSPIQGKQYSSWGISVHSSNVMPLLNNRRSESRGGGEQVKAGQNHQEQENNDNSQWQNTAEKLPQPSTYYYDRSNEEKRPAKLTHRNFEQHGTTPTTSSWIIDLDAVAAIDNEEHDHFLVKNNEGEEGRAQTNEHSRQREENAFQAVKKVVGGSFAASASTGEMSEEDDDEVYEQNGIFENEEGDSIIELSSLLDQKDDETDDGNARLDYDEGIEGSQTIDDPSPASLPLLQLRGGGRSNNNSVSAPKTSVSQKTSKASSTSSSVFVGSVFNLVNNVAGAGILTLAAGKATGTGWIPSIIICASLAALSAHTFTLVGRACDLSGEQDFAGLWARAFGPESSYIVSLIVSLQGTTSQIIYIGMIGEVFSALFKMIGVTFMDRTKCILLMSTVALWPMCLLRDLSSLAFTSILGFSAVMYTVLFIVVRALDGSYDLSRNGQFVSTAKDISMLTAGAPSFEKSSWWNVDFGSLILMSNLGLAYIAHYNAPTYWREMKQKMTKEINIANNKGESSIDVSKMFSDMVRTSYGILAMIYVAAMCGGYYTFGDTCLGNILMNYHPRDILSTLGRVATGWSIVFGFPLVHNGAREGIKSFTQRAFGWTALTNPQNHSILATVYLIFVTTVAIMVKDVRLVVGLAGAAFGSFLVYICPVWIYLMIIRSLKGPQSKEYGIAKRNNLLLIPFGIFCGSMGVAMTLKEAFKRAAMEAATSASS